MIVFENIVYYAILSFFVYFINGGGWRKYIFDISRLAYDELMNIEYMFFPKSNKIWKEKWFKITRFIWARNLIFTGSSQIIGIVIFLKVSPKLQSLNIYYLYPAIFIVFIPTIFAILAVICRRVFLEDIIEYLERISERNENDSKDNK